MGVLMHLGIGALMGMWTFGLIMIFGYLCFYSGEQIRFVLAGLQEWWMGQKTVSFYPAQPETVAAAARVRAWDISNSVSYIKTASASAAGQPAGIEQPFQISPLDLPESPAGT